ncbi:pyrroloquinoline quinone biosynthesis protein E [Panacagrimonas perspica]|uniref:PqqA peptide cyclase n=1 Tax=Panacagrimonas perspica TaxID=381431 RepID=A0A4R7NXT8_9GAMM|nr:pyrroloquinoline quinone biosynthesis protein PqqE [Panacagrimonas perspica]TDU25682.1 pyrroloquinoline quinone biosynthesis protein E [Panacagrimonas perspica]
MPSRDGVGMPMWLLAEVTYRCPLHCVFCYNPVDYAKQHQELTTEEWKRVLRESRELGAAQLGLSGGEPLLRDDLEEIVREARSLGYYTNLLTSGIGMTEARIAALKGAGLDHIQLSFQDSTKQMNDFLSSTRTFDLKMKVAALIKQYDYPMVLNCVLHRYNIDHVQQILEMAEAMGAEYVELANTQFYSWAYLNKDQLLPTREQVEHAELVTDAFREKVKGRMRLFFVMPDYHATRPKKCTNGWGNLFITVQADGTVLPCHVAGMLPGMTFPNVREHSMEWAWYDSPGFNRFRGDGWMKDPCRTCPEKEKDLGGCRCQAYMLTGDAENADPVCDKSPHHERIREVVERTKLAVNEQPIVFRTDRDSRDLMKQCGEGGLKVDERRLFEPGATATEANTRIGRTPA